VKVLILENFFKYRDSIKTHLNKIKLICANAYEMAHSTNDKPLSDEEKYTRLGFTVNPMQFFCQVFIKSPFKNLKFYKRIPQILLKIFKRHHRVWWHLNF